MLFSNIENLVESGSINEIGNLEPLMESYITPDQAGLGQITLENTMLDAKINEATAMADQKLLEAEINGVDSEKIEALQEAVVGDVFKKILDKFKEMYQKILGFFKKLFASIAVSCGDVEKALNNAKEYLKGDFSKYEYSMMEWKKSDIANVISKNLTAGNDTLINFINSSTNGKADDMPQVTQTQIIGELITGNPKDTSMEEAKTVIANSYLNSPTPEKKTGLSNINELVSYLKGFKNNETLKKLQADAQKEYQKAVQAAQKAYDKSKSLAKDDEHRSEAIRISKTNLSTLSARLNIYNGLMGQCITMEKKKFAEYKRVVSGAIRYRSGSNGDK